MFFQHRHVRLQNLPACVSDVRRYLSCQGSVLGDEICLKVLAKNDYTRLSNFVKDKLVLVRHFNLKILRIEGIPAIWQHTSQ